MVDPLMLIVDIFAGIYASLLTYAYIRGRMVSIASTLRETAISVTMFFIGVWYLIEAFPVVLAWATAISWLCYERQVNVQRRGAAKMQSKE